MKLSGLAIVTNSVTTIGGAFKEVVAPSALAGLDTSGLRFLRDHDSSRVVARAKSGTMTSKVTSRGLEVTAELADTTDGRDLFELVKRGDVDGMSFAFALPADGSGDEWVAERGDELPTRVIRKFAAVFEVSGVSFPAYPATSLGEGLSAPASPRRSALVERLDLATRDRWDVERLARTSGVYPIPRPRSAPMSGRREVRGGIDPYVNPETGKLFRTGDVRGAYYSLATRKGLPVEEVEALALAGRLAEVVRMADCREFMDYRAGRLTDVAVDNLFGAMTAQVAEEND